MTKLPYLLLGCALFALLFVLLFVRRFPPGRGGAVV